MANNNNDDDFRNDDNIDPSEELMSFLQHPPDNEHPVVFTKLEEKVIKLGSDYAFTYVRSDGRPQVLTLAEVFRRADALEMGYNPNDSVEVRWGAPEASEERASARRRAPASQLAKMRDLRPWFHKRLRPS